MADFSYRTPETRTSLITRLPNAADIAAWDEFTQLYTPVIYRVARQQRLQPADAENLTQEVMVAVVRSLPQWLDRADRGSFRGWLLRIARNACIDMLQRRGTRRLGWDGSWAELQLAALPARESELSAQIELEYQREKFRWAADQVRLRVADATWRAFWLTQVVGLSVAAAAEELQVRPGKIYVSRSRVMHQIRQAVERWEDR